MFSFQSSFLFGGPWEVSSLTSELGSVSENEGVTDLFRLFLLCSLLVFPSTCSFILSCLELT